MKMMDIVQARWRATSPREQRLLLVAFALVLGALLWWVALAPALATLKGAETRQRVLDAQWQQMQRLQAQAQALQAQPPLAPAVARGLLEASLKTLGDTAQLSVTGERVTVTLKATSADALAQWLAQVRLNVRTAPSEARLVRNAAGSWDGALVLTLTPAP
jgi:general secretion pathway protein M